MQSSARAGASADPFARRAPLGGGFGAQRPKKGGKVGELGFEAGLDLEGMVGDATGGVVLELFFQAEDAAAQLEVLGQEAGAVVFETADLLGLVRVDAGDVAVLAEEFSPDWR